MHDSARGRGSIARYTRRFTCTKMNYVCHKLCCKQAHYIDLADTEKFDNELMTRSVCWIPFQCMCRTWKKIKAPSNVHATCIL